MQGFQFDKCSSGCIRRPNVATRRGAHHMDRLLGSGGRGGPKTPRGGDHENENERAGTHCRKAAVTE